MFRHLLPVALLLMLALVGFAESAPQGFEFSGLAHKVSAGPDKDGDLNISVKVSVHNATDTDQDVKIVVRAIDMEDYKILEIPLTWKVKAWSDADTNRHAVRWREEVQDHRTVGN